MLLLCTFGLCDVTFSKADGVMSSVGLVWEKRKRKRLWLI